MRLGRFQAEQALREYVRPPVDGVDAYVLSYPRNIRIELYSRASGVPELIEQVSQHKRPGSKLFPDLMPVFMVLGNRHKINSVVMVSVPEDTPWLSLAAIAEEYSARWIQAPFDAVSALRKLREAVVAGKCCMSLKAIDSEEIKALRFAAPYIFPKRFTALLDLLDR